MIPVENNELFIKLSFSKEFVECFQEIQDMLGDEVLDIMGVANSKLDIVNFSNEFFINSNVSTASSLADVTVDDNANVSEKSFPQYFYEQNKGQMRLYGLYLIFEYVKKLYDEHSARSAVKRIMTGDIFVNDLHLFPIPYCYSIDLSLLLTDGMSFFKSNFKINPPKRSSSFIALVIQATAYISNQIAGAVAYPNLFVMMDWFYRKEFGDDYMHKIRSKFGRIHEDSHVIEDDIAILEMWRLIKEQFQNLIFSLNFPFRSNQSPFTNVSILDQGFLEGLFKDYSYPDFTKPNYNSIKELSKIFFEYFSLINLKEGVFTFPVTTLACSLTTDGEYIDPDFVDWVAEVNCGKALGNVFVDLPTSFSSCCRLRNTFEDNPYINSFGVGGVSIGSHRVCGLNLPRLAIKMKQHNYNVLEDNLDIIHKILIAHRVLLQERIDGNYLPLYTSGWMSLRKQFSTVGFIGATEFDYILKYFQSKEHTD